MTIKFKKLTIGIATDPCGIFKTEHTFKSADDAEAFARGMLNELGNRPVMIQFEVYGHTVTHTGISYDKAKRMREKYPDAVISEAGELEGPNAIGELPKKYGFFWDSGERVRAEIFETRLAAIRWWKEHSMQRWKFFIVDGTPTLFHPGSDKKVEIREIPPITKKYGFFHRDSVRRVDGYIFDSVPDAVDYYWRDGYPAYSNGYPAYSNIVEIREIPPPVPKTDPKMYSLREMIGNLVPGDVVDIETIGGKWRVSDGGVIEFTQEDIVGIVGIVSIPIKKPVTFEEFFDSFVKKHEDVIDIRSMPFLAEVWRLEMADRESNWLTTFRNPYLDGPPIPRPDPEVCERVRLKGMSHAVLITGKNTTSKICRILLSHWR